MIKGLLSGGWSLLQDGSDERAEKQHGPEVVHEEAEL